MIRRAPAALLLLVACSRSAGKEVLQLAAASDLALAVPELRRAWQARSGQVLEVSLGASGLLARQLEEGAPFDVFASAAPRFVDDTVKAGACDAATVTAYARGHLVLVTATGIVPPRELGELADARFTRVAIANPETAPYGLAAEEALRQAGVLAALRPRLVRADSARQALEQVERGNVEVALVARALTFELPRERVTEVDPALHAPIQQTAVACGPRGRAFIAWLVSPEGQAILARHGFDPPR